MGRMKGYVAAVITLTFIVAHARAIALSNGAVYNKVGLDWGIKRGDAYPLPDITVPADGDGDTFAITSVAAAPSTATSDGITVVVGSQEYPPHGAAFVMKQKNLEQESEGFVVTATLLPSLAADDRFGTLVAIADGIIVVSADGLEQGGDDDTGGVYVYTLADPAEPRGAWVERQILRPTSGAASATYGRVLALNNLGIIVVGSNQPTRGLGRGAALIFKPTNAAEPAGGSWTLADTLDLSAVASSVFAQGVAINDGNLIAVGIDNEAAPQSEAVMVYAQGTPGGAWTLASTIPMPIIGTVLSYTAFGYSMQISSSNTIAVGAHNYEDGVGKVFMYKPTVVSVFTAWTLDATLVSGDTSAANFGTSLALTDDLMIVGAPRASGTLTNEGSAYSFVHDGEAWVRVAKLASHGTHEFGQLGSSVAVAGTFMLASHWGDPHKAVATFLVADGVEMTRFRPTSYYVAGMFGKLVAADGDTVMISQEDQASIGDMEVYFSQVSTSTGVVVMDSVAGVTSAGSLSDLSLDVANNVALAGCGSCDTIGQTAAGRASVMLRNPTTGVWSTGPTLQLASPTAGDGLGSSVLVMGAAAVLGAPGFDDGGVQNSGKIFLFAPSNAGDLSQPWVPAGGLALPGAGEDKRFGSSMAGSSTLLAVGASGGQSAFPGSVHILKPIGNTGLWAFDGELPSPNTDSTSDFGLSLAVYGTTVVVGEPDTVNAVFPKVHVYKKEGPTWKLTATMDGGTSGFGISVAFAGGDIFVGSTGGASGKGEVVRYDTSGSEVMRYSPASTLNGGAFGGSVAVTETLLAVGADNQEGEGVTVGGYVYTIPVDHLLLGPTQSIFNALVSRGCLIMGITESPPIVIGPAVTRELPASGFVLQSQCSLWGTQGNAAVLTHSDASSKSAFKTESIPFSMRDIKLRRAALAAAGGGRRLASGIPGAGGLIQHTLAASSTPLPFELTRVELEGGSAVEGGAVYVSGPAIVTLASSAFYGSSASVGGALFLSGCTATVTNCSFTANSVLRGGGAISVQTGAVLSLVGVPSNAAPTSVFDSNTAQIEGGAIVANFGATVTISNYTFANNTAIITGGALFVDGLGARIEDCVFRDNKALDGDGGAVSASHVTSGTLIIKDCTFTQNGASLTGGAVELSYSVAEITGAEFNKNIAVEQGGAVYAQQGSLRLIAKLHRNEVLAGNGGAVACDSCKMDITNSEFDSNLVFTTASSSGRGGGLYCSGTASEVEVAVTTFNSNRAAVAGGAVATSNCELLLQQCSFADNKVDERLPVSPFREVGGGAMYIELDATVNTVNITTTSFKRNLATVGGALYMQVDASNNSCIRLPQRCADDSGIAPKVLLGQGVTWGSAADANEASRNGVNVHWVNRLPGGPGYTGPLAAPPSASSMPVSLRFEPATVSAETAQVVTPAVTAIPIDYYGMKSWSNALLAEQLQLSGQDATLAGNGATFGDEGVAVLSGLTVGGLANSSVQVRASLQPNSLGATAATLRVDLHPCTAGNGPSADQRSCTPCVAGTFSKTGTCSSCAAGSYADEPGTQQCIQCSPGKYNPDVGQSTAAACLDCPENTVTSDSGATSASQCEPAAGYVVTVVRGSTEILACPRGFNCSMGAASVQLLPLQTGYWRSTGTTLRARSCLQPEHCPGGLFNASASENGVCREGHGGPFCSQCQEGYFMSGGLCEICPDSPTGAIIESLAILVAMFVVGLCAAVMVCMCVRRRKAAAAARNDSVTPVNVPGFSSIDHRGQQGQAQSKSQAEREASEAWQAYEAKAYELAQETLARNVGAQKFDATAAKSAQLKGLLLKVKLLLSFLQIMSSFQSTLTVAWPPAFLEFMRLFAFVNFEVLSILSTGCVAERNLYSDLVFVTVTPVVVASLLWLYYAGARCCVSKARREAIFNRVAWLFLFMLFLIYPTVSQKTFAAFVCDSDFEDGSSFLKADYSISCLAPERPFWVTYATICMLVYPVGIPVFYSTLLFINRKHINPSKAIGGVPPDHPRFYDVVIATRPHNPRLKALVFLFGSYEPRAFFFEVLELIRKVLLTGFIVLFASGTPTQIVAAILVTLVSVAVTHEMGPYVMKSDDWVAVLGSYQLLLTLLMALVSASGVAERDGYSDALGTIMIITTVATIVLTIAAVFAGQCLKRWYKVRYENPDVTNFASKRGLKAFVGLAQKQRGIKETARVTPAPGRPRSRQEKLQSAAKRAARRSGGGGAWGEGKAGPALL